MNAKIKPARLTVAAVILAMLLLSAFTNRPYWLFTYDSSLAARRLNWSDGMLEYEEIDTREEGLEMEGRIPSLTAHTGVLQNRVNAAIDGIISDKISDAREIRARSLTFAYETHFSDPYMSIILKSTATSASSKTEVVSVNFNVNTGELLSASDVVGPHVVNLADRLLVEMVRRDPARYNPNFAGMRQDQAFSITDTEVTFWFNEFQLAPGFEGIVPVSLQLGDIREITLMREDYHVREGFNLKMVPLRRVAEALGYRVAWNRDSRGSSVFFDGELVIKITPGVNNYIREQRFTRSLEAAPAIVDGTTYVPISFFDQILSLVAFSIDEDDNITFASYPVTDEWFESQN